MNLGVLFDMDGTLVPFHFDIQGSRKALFNELSRLGFKVEGLALNSPTQAVVDAAKKQIQDGTVKSDFDTIRRKLFSILDDFELQSGRSVTAFLGAREVLSDLHERGAKLGLLTNSGKRATSAILERSGFNPYFDFILTRDEVEAMKPRPDGLKKAIAMFSLPKERVVYVGDSLYDIIAAKAAGLKVISVATGNYTEEKLRNEGADVVVRSLGELPSAIPL